MGRLSVRATAPQGHGDRMTTLKRPPSDTKPAFSAAKFAGITTAIGFAGAAVGGVLIEIGKRQGLSSGDVLRDVAAVFDLPSMAGGVTWLTVSLLVAAGAVALVTALTVQARRSVAVLVAVLSLTMAVDDQFMLHERVLPHVTGLPEAAFVAVYALLGAAILVLTLRECGKRGTAGLWPALVFMGLSVITDFDLLGDSSYATEDLLKLAGFSAWTSFWMGYARMRLRPAPA
ncbi:hypothetical protein AL036_11700 [Salipiger aestuarii]|nr:hypothetical protein AL036_11700 [Salipiger aestuarii]KAA8611015.1 hypothetical protein AL037_10800 [Salipiger aestuarii]KAB2542249.1 hypothetical protein AL035_07740 [Salipiger aestuarii]